MFAGSHLLTAQKRESECYVIDWFTGMIAKWSEYCALLDAVGELHVNIRNTIQGSHVVLKRY